MKRSAMISLLLVSTDATAISTTLMIPGMCNPDPIKIYIVTIQPQKHPRDIYFLNWKRIKLPNPYLPIKVWLSWWIWVRKQVGISITTVFYRMKGSAL